MRISTSALLVIGIFGLSGPCLARDIYLRKSTADEIKAACDKAGGKFSQDAHGFGCGTDCHGGAGTDCVVYCKTDEKCVAQVVGGRRPTSLESALQTPQRHAR